MKTVWKYIMPVAVAAAFSAVPAMASQQDSTAGSVQVYTIEDCYSLVRENYPLVRRYELLDLTEEYTLKMPI